MSYLTAGKSDIVLGGYLKIDALDNVSHRSLVNLEGRCDITASRPKWLGVLREAEGILRISNDQEITFTYLVHPFHLGSSESADNLLGYLVLGSCAQEGRSVSLYGKLDTKETNRLRVKHVRFKGRLKNLKLNGRPLREVWHDIFNQKNKIYTLI